MAMSCQAAGEEEEKVATDEDGTLAAVFLASSLFRGHLRHLLGHEGAAAAATIPVFRRTRRRRHVSCAG